MKKHLFIHSNKNNIIDFIIVYTSKGFEVKNITSFFLIFQSPSKFIVFVVSISIMTKIPRFFQFELKDDGTDYKISDMMGDPIYIRFTSYWDDILVTGFIPLLLLLYFNLKLYFKVFFSKRAISADIKHCLICLISMNFLPNILLFYRFVHQRT